MDDTEVMSVVTQASDTSAKSEKQVASQGEKGGGRGFEENKGAVPVRERDPCGLLVLFPICITAAIAQKLLMMGKTAREILFGRRCFMKYTNEVDAKKTKNKLCKIQLDGIKPHVNSPFRLRKVEMMPMKGVDEGTHTGKGPVDESNEEASISAKKEEDPYSVLLLFRNPITAQTASELLSVGQTASELTFLKMCYMTYPTEEAALRTKNEICKMDFNGITPHVETAFIPREGRQSDRKCVAKERLGTCGKKCPVNEVNEEAFISDKAKLPSNKVMRRKLQQEINSARPPIASANDESVHVTAYERNLNEGQHCLRVALQLYKTIARSRFQEIKKLERQLREKNGMLAENENEIRVLENKVKKLQENLNVAEKKAEDITFVMLRMRAIRGLDA
ncbi:uncharacterized protein [Procambarus clarkii]|uniref:uncharacterized protein isoform X3 n=1 Tax=Procambarus clarkii TaxID=6728 RepID=UPI003742EC86